MNTTIPSLLDVALGVYKALGCNNIHHQKLQRVKSLEKISEAKLNEVMNDVFKEISIALEIDKESRTHEQLYESCLGFAEIYGLLDVATDCGTQFKADPIQIAWEVLIRIVTPYWAVALGKSLSKRTLRNEIPEDHFWYLPQRVEQNPDKVTLPVPFVMNWWLQLIGSSTESIAQLIYKHIQEVDPTDNDDVEGIKKNLNNWRSGNSLPSRRLIEKYFPDSMRFDYKRAFPHDKESDPDKKSTEVFLYMLCGNATEDELHVEEDVLPFVSPPQFTPGQIKSILNTRSGKNIEKGIDAFYNCFAEQYSPPNNITIRRKLRIARSVQYLYKYLKKSLSSHFESCVSTRKHEAKADELINDLIEHYKRIYKGVNLGMLSDKVNDELTDLNTYIAFPYTRIKSVNEIGRMALFIESIDNKYNMIQSNTIKTVKDIIEHDRDWLKNRLQPENPTGKKY